MTGAEKVKATLKAFTDTPDDADAMQLTLATVAMGLESQSGFLASMEASQESGELDEFVAALTRWIATHRSDHAEQLLVVELPRGRGPFNDIPAGVVLERCRQGAEKMLTASSPL
jgi:hypothetical protein